MVVRQGVTLLLFSIALLFGCGKGGKEVPAPDLYEQAIAAYDVAATFEELEQEVLPLLDKAVEADPKDVDALIARAIVHEELEDLDRARKDYETAIAANPEEPNIYVNQGAMLFGQEEYLQAIEAYGRALALDEDDAEAYRGRGLALMELQKHREAIVDLTRAILVDQEVEGVVYRDRAKAWRAIDNELQAEVDERIADATDVIEKDPDKLAAYLARAKDLYLLGEFDFAAADCNQVITRNPNDAEALLLRGHAYYSVGDLDESAADFEAAIELDDKLATAWLGRGLVREQQEEFTDAIADFRRGVQLDKENLEGRALLAWLLATCPDAALRNGEEAAQLAAALCEATDSKNWSFLHIHAAACAETDDFDQAVALATAALKLAPEDAAEDVQSAIVAYQKNQPYTHK